MATLSTRVEQVPQAQLAVGESASLTIEESPSLRIEWSTTDASVATVDSHGTVVGVSPGRATVVGRYRDGSVVCRIVVQPTRRAIPEDRSAPLTLGFARTNVTLSERESLNLSGLVAVTGGRAERRPDGSALEWSVQDTSIIRIDQTGVVTALRTGKSIVRVRLEGVSASLPVEVLPARLERIEISDAPKSLRTGERIHLRATPFGVDDVPLTGRTVTWKSSATEVLSVDVRGVAQGRAPGVATVTAECGSRRAAVSILVEAAERPAPVSENAAPIAPAAIVVETPRSRRPWVAGGLLTLVAIVGWLLLSRGELRPDTLVSSNESGPTAADPSSPAPTLAPQVSASPLPPESPSRSSEDGGAVRAEVLVATSRLEVGDSTPIGWRAIGTDGRGVPFDVARLRWSTSDSSVLGLTEQQNYARAIRPGVATLTVRLGAVSGRRTMTVVPATIESMHLVFDRENLVAGQRGTWQMIALDRRGGPVAVRIDSVSVIPSDVLEVTTSGTLEGRAPGNAVVTVYASGRAVTRGISVRVRPSAVAERAVTTLAAGLVSAIRRQAVQEVAAMFLSASAAEGISQWMRDLRSLRIEGNPEPEQQHETASGAVYELRVPVRWNGRAGGTARGASADTLTFRLRVSVTESTPHLNILGVSAPFLR